MRHFAIVSHNLAPHPQPLGLADKNTASIMTGVVRRDGRDTALMFTLEL